ncbi:hypothetical protein MBLNU230_g4797t1 [Neophaeotheca triangularis]
MPSPALLTMSSDPYGPPPANRIPCGEPPDFTPISVTLLLKKCGGGGGKAAITAIVDRKSNHNFISHAFTKKNRLKPVKAKANEMQSPPQVHDTLTLLEPFKIRSLVPVSTNFQQRFQQTFWSIAYDGYDLVLGQPWLEAAKSFQVYHLDPFPRQLTPKKQHKSFFNSTDPTTQIESKECRALLPFPNWDKVTPELA